MDEDQDEDEMPAEGPTAPGSPNIPPVSTSTELDPSFIKPVQPTELPSNAIELSNTAPIHTEAGLGDLGASDGSIEIKAGQPASDSVIQADGSDALDPAKEGVDEGLVMGEMDPPESELAVVGGDHGPPEIESK